MLRVLFHPLTKDRSSDLVGAVLVEPDKVTLEQSLYRAAHTLFFQAALLLNLLQVPVLQLSKRDQTGALLFVSANPQIAEVAIPCLQYLLNSVLHITDLSLLALICIQSVNNL